ncbi:MAG TPA: PQQ-binding-like beta-propeller repeat protein [Candidatus Limnocylindria bacterium]|jgi:outer membrane protein assembly factor BamB|nr:PQQ-binding-like beta-propeller repeat protein [Candidatus Limnocylindria bacterium]
MIQKATKIAVCAAGLTWVVARSAWAGDWPQFFGPHRDGSTEESLAVEWPGGSPKTRWHEAVGQGFSGPVVRGGKVILFTREGDQEVLKCRDTTTGKTVWQQALPTSYTDDFGFDEGPRATPLIVGDCVYAMGAAGHIRCVSFADGKLQWQKDAAKEFSAGKGYFGFACSPVSVTNAVVFQVGGEAATLVALEPATGKLLWKSGSHEAGYASPRVVVKEGRERLLSFDREGLSVIEGRTGVELFQFHWRARMAASVNAASPVLDGERVFLTASYGTGAVLLKPVKDTYEAVWSDQEGLSAHFTTPVLYQGHLYGYHGRQEQGQELRCIDLETGKVRWSEPQFGTGSVIRSGSLLVLVKESGELVLAKADPAGLRPLAQSQIVGSGVRALPALSDGCLYVRDKRQLHCIELK